MEGPTCDAASRDCLSRPVEWLGLGKASWLGAQLQWHVLSEVSKTAQCSHQLREKGPPGRRVPAGGRQPFQKGLPATQRPAAHTSDFAHLYKMLGVYSSTQNEHSSAFSRVQQCLALPQCPRDSLPSVCLTLAFPLGPQPLFTRGVSKYGYQVSCLVRRL